MTLHMRFRFFLLTLFFALAAIEGAIALAKLLQDPSMERNAVLVGFSVQRLIIGSAVALVVLFMAWLSIRSALSLSWTESLIVALDRRFLEKGQFALIVAVCVHIIVLIGLLILVINSPLSLYLGMLVVVFQRVKFILLWVCILATQSIILLALYYPHLFRSLSTSEPQLREQIAAAILSVTAIAGIIGALVTTAFKANIFMFLSILLLIAVGLQLLRIFLHRHRQNAPWYHGVVVALNAASVFCAVTILYRLTTMYVGMLSTPSKSYFDSLAAAWLDGRLFLLNPYSTHDLTLFNGNWYVANPPLVALLMLPFVALFGLPALNTVVFSILFAALNAALIYALLEKITARGWVQLGWGDSLWLTALFALGTAHWYLGVVGKMWFMSQITTVTFLALWKSVV